MVISIRNNRFCLNVGREHQSNGIFFVLDVERLIFTQRCHACKFYVSKPFHIVKELVQSKNNPAGHDTGHIPRCEHALIAKMIEKEQIMVDRTGYRADSCKSFSNSRYPVLVGGKRALETNSSNSDTHRQKRARPSCEAKPGNDSVYFGRKRESNSRAKLAKHRDLFGKNRERKFEVKSAEHAVMLGNNLKSKQRAQPSCDANAEAKQAKHTLLFRKNSEKNYEDKPVEYTVNFGDKQKKNQTDSIDDCKQSI